MPYLAKMPFSLATNSGAASVSAMKPRLALVVSGPAACATCAPNGNAVFAAAQQCGGAGGLQERAPADASRDLCGHGSAVPFFVVGARPATCPDEPIKKPQPETRVCGASSERRRCLSARHWTSGAAFQAAPIVLSFTSGVPTRWRGKNRCEINREKLIAAIRRQRRLLPIRCIGSKILQIYCAVRKIRQPLISQANRPRRYCVGIFAAFTSATFASTSSLMNLANSAWRHRHRIDAERCEPRLHGVGLECLCDLARAASSTIVVRRLRRQVDAGIERIDRARRQTRLDRGRDIREHASRASAR